MKLTVILFCALLFQAGLSAEDYDAALAKLISGKENISVARQNKLSAAEVVDLKGDIAGVRFGMTMQQVVDVWGTPHAIWVKHDDRIELKIYASNFTFDEGKLVEISLHGVDLPKLKMFGGQLAFNQPVPDVKAVFKDATVTKLEELSSYHIEWENGEVLQFQILDERIIAIAFKK